MLSISLVNLIPMQDKKKNTENPPLRKVTSYVLRERRMTLRQKYALETFWKQFGLEMQSGPIDFVTVFAREAPRILEIGFGMGLSLLETAAAHPENDYIGIEVHRPGVGSLLAGIEEAKLTNIRIFCADAVSVLQQCISDNSLDIIQIFFPDPWPKTRHHKRRLIQRSFVELLSNKLKPFGRLHLATDWEDYANHMMKVCSNVDSFNNLAGAFQFSERPAYRPLTKFEARGQRLGHSVWDLIFVKV